MKYKNVRKPLAEIASALHAEAVVQGSVVRYEGKLRITAQLIDARTERHLWAEDYNRDLCEMLWLYKTRLHDASRRRSGLP